MLTSEKFKVNPSINLLKALAMLFMTIDHIGLFFFPNQVELRMIGRLAAPIFTYLIVEGVRRGHHLNRYIIRLIILALVSQLTFSLTTGTNGLNIIFNFLLLIAFITSNWPGRFLVPLVYLLIEIEYGPLVLLLGAAYYFGRTAWVKAVLSSLANLGFGLCMAIRYELRNVISVAQIFAVFSSPLILAVDWSQQRLEKISWLNRVWPRWLFYAYYPVHWSILFFISLALGN